MLVIWYDLAMPRRAVACWGLPVMSVPSNQMRPEVGALSPEIKRKRVVLPAPLGPMIERSSPRRTLTSTPDTAMRLPYARVRRSVRSRTASDMRGECTGDWYRVKARRCAKVHAHGPPRGAEALEERHDRGRRSRVCLRPGVGDLSGGRHRRRERR